MTVCVMTTEGWWELRYVSVRWPWRKCSLPQDLRAPVEERWYVRQVEWEEEVRDEIRPRLYTCIAFPDWITPMCVECHMRLVQTSVYCLSWIGTSLPVSSRERQHRSIANTDIYDIEPQHERLTLESSSDPVRNLLSRAPALLVSCLAENSVDTLVCKVASALPYPKTFPLSRSLPLTHRAHPVDRAERLQLRVEHQCWGSLLSVVCVVCGLVGWLAGVYLSGRTG